MTLDGRAARSSGGTEEDGTGGTDPSAHDSLIDRLSPHLALEPRVVHLLALAIVSGPSTNGNLAVPGIVAGARRAGVREEDILESRRLGGAIAMHSISWGLERVLVELREGGFESDEDPGDGVLGSPYPGFALAAHHSPAALGVLRAQYDAPVPGSQVTPLERTLIFLAIDINCCHMYERGMRTHVRTAKEHGVSTRQLVEVGLVAACLGELSLLAPATRTAE